MAYSEGDFDRKHLLVTWGGTLPGPETWSCSLKLADGRTGSPALANDIYLGAMDLQGAVDGWIGDSISAFHTSGIVGPQAVLTFAKVALIERNGRYNDASPFVRAFANIAGTGSNIGYPNQIAMCVSLRSDKPRGVGSKGRFFLPQPSAPVISGTGLISEAKATEAVGYAAAFLVSISDVGGLDLPSSPGAVLMSRKSGAAVTKQVTSVKVGRALDTIRSRRRGLVEGYKSANVDQGLA